MASKNLKHVASATDGSPDTEKRQVSVSTFKKWQSQYECEHQSLSWLRCDVDKANRELVGQLWCEACRKHKIIRHSNTVRPH